MGSTAYAFPGRDQWSAATLRDHVRRAIAGTGEIFDEQVFRQFAERLSMVSGDFGDQRTYDRVARAIEGRRSPVFYLEIPPSLFGRVVEGLAGACACTLHMTVKVVLSHYIPIYVDE
jgi:glucose-6-phosphate 1-dehydrogenase